MKIKIKKKKRKVKVNKKLKAEAAIYIPSAFDKFKKELANSSNPLYFIHKTHLDLFKKTPPEGIHRIMIRTKIEYEYCHQDLLARKQKPSKLFLKRYYSAMKFSLSDLGSASKTILLNEMKEEVMAKTKKKEARSKAEKTAKKNGTSAFRKCIGKSLKMGIQETWAHLFAKNETEKKKKSDKEISDLIKSEFPDRKTAAFNNVPFVRGRYNRGLLMNGIIPKAQSVCYIPMPGTKASKRFAKENEKKARKSTTGKLKTQVKKAKIAKVAKVKVRKAMNNAASFINKKLAKSKAKKK